MIDHIYTAERLNSEIWCRLGPSKVHGVGVFAIRDIPEDTILSPIPDISERKTGMEIMMSESEWQKIHPEIKKILLDRNCYITNCSEIPEGCDYAIEHPNTHQDFICFMNQSDNPNSSGYVSKRLIKAGEEITEAYLVGNHETTEHMRKQGIRIN